ncbi:hypothetical protein, partial [Halobacillus campisalis]|uniref:hypothetical protein n=1 Tax=Halobacillus campisalis TaxID=435909 RepID=UPI00259BD374
PYKIIKIIYITMHTKNTIAIEEIIKAIFFKKPFSLFSAVMKDPSKREPNNKSDKGPSTRFNSHTRTNNTTIEATINNKETIAKF